MPETRLDCFDKKDLARRLIVCRALAMEHGMPLGFHDEEDQFEWDRKAVELLHELDAAQSGQKEEK